MITITNTQEYTDKRIKQIETKLTSLCLQGNDLVPEGYAFNIIRSMNRELLDITNGTNAIAFDKKGRPFVAYVIDCDNLARTERYEALLGSSSTRFSDAWENILPCFIRSNAPKRYLLIQKYKCSRADGKNHSVGLYGLPPAYGESASFSMSYDGINAECDRINKMHHEGLDIHEITWDEISMLILESAFLNRSILGNTDSGTYSDIKKAGALCGYMDSNKFVHTLNGSGPLSWKHNGRASGVDGLNGNLKTIVAGIRIENGELQVIDFRSTKGVLDSEALTLGTSYRAIANDASKVSLVPIKSPNTIKIDFENKPSSSKSYPHRISTSITTRTDTYASTTDAKTVGASADVAENPLLRFMGILPYATNSVNGYQYLKNNADMTSYLAYGSDWASKNLNGANSKTCIGQGEASPSLGGLLASNADVLEY